MDWDDFRYFLAVSRHASISAAAKALGVQHSTMARRIKGLEEELGCRLFDRIEGRHVLTEAGRDVEESAERVEQEILGLDRRVLGRDGLLSGPLRVSTADAMAVTFLMPIFRRFASLYPQVALSVSASNSYVDLAKRDADVVIRASNAPGLDLHGRKEASLAFAVYGSHTYLDALGTAPAAWVMPDGGLPHQAWVSKQKGSAAVALTVDEATLTHAAVAQGAGVGLLPCFMGDADSSLRRYRNPDPETNIDLWLLLHGDLKTTAKVRAFVDFVREALREQLDLLEGRRPGGRSAGE